MAAGVRAALAAAFLALAALLVPGPGGTPPPSVAAPLAQRTLAGPFRALAADRYWLAAARRSAGGAVNRQRLFRELRTTVALDPGFRPALRYGATYFASVAEDLGRAHALCDQALRFRPAAAYPYLLKAVLELGYAPRPDRAAMRAWLGQARANGAGAAWIGDLRQRLGADRP